MGRHSATDGDSAHPLVVAALIRRSADGTRTPRGATAASPEGGSVGWPSPPPEPDGGLGWPGGADDDDAQDRSVDAPVARRGWRRLFGAAPAA